MLQDNDPKHTSNMVKLWLHINGVVCIEFPPYSPDLNPVENLWNNLKRRVEQHHAHNIEELEQYVYTEWDATDQDFLAALVNSMPRRCAAVVAAKGDLIDY